MTTMSIKNSHLLDAAKAAGVPMTLYTDPDTGEMGWTPSHAAEARRIFREQERERQADIEREGGEWGVFYRDVGCKARGCRLTSQWSVRDLAWRVTHGDDLMEVSHRITATCDEWAIKRHISQWVHGLHRTADERERGKLIYEMSGS